MASTSVKTKFERPDGVPDSKVKLVNIPEPAAIIAPSKENPKTVVAPADNVKPAACAAPPEAPLTTTSITPN